ncbi:MAG TPA: cupin domain-containing protein [Saprospiraceae bacterium]|nr:cupin domain-containing protein [Saprospiraceae bacterium]
MDLLDFQPVIKTRATVLKSAVNKLTDPVVMLADIGPFESGPPLHFHPNQTETYEVLEGEVEFILSGKVIRLKPGEIINIPINTPHTFKNITENWLKMKDTHIPALSFEEMMRDLHQLVIKSGKIKSFKDVKSLIYLSMLWIKYKDSQRSVDPPYFIMKIMAGIGKLTGFKI